MADAWQIVNVDQYAAVPRMGRRTRLGARQRENLWPVIENVRRALAERRLTTPAALFAKLTSHYVEREAKPFSHIVVDEAQDLGVPELRFLAAIALRGPDALFFAGDLGQRIFQPPFSWKGLGIDVRGRSFTLRVGRAAHIAPAIRPGIEAMAATLVEMCCGRSERALPPSGRSSAELNTNMR